MCDQISDAILDAHLKQDPDAKVACGEFYLICVFFSFDFKSFKCSRRSISLSVNAWLQYKWPGCYFRYYWNVLKFLKTFFYTTRLRWGKHLVRTKRLVSLSAKYYKRLILLSPFRCVGLNNGKTLNSKNGIILTLRLLLLLLKNYVLLSSVVMKILVQSCSMRFKTM